MVRRMTKDKCPGRPSALILGEMTCSAAMLQQHFFVTAISIILFLEFYARFYFIGNISDRLRDEGCRHIIRRVLQTLGGRFRLSSTCTQLLALQYFAPKKRSTAIEESLRGWQDTM
jgi:hypothetical protein